MALHRYLKARRGAAYDYDRHVGGLLYLFVRGMEGPGTPRPAGECHGVYSDRWPAELVLAFDRALLAEG